MLVLQTSCQNNSAPPSVETETSKQKEEIVEIDSNELHYFEYKIFEKSNFTENQIKPNLVYVFAGGTLLYDNENQDIVIANLDFGDVLTVIQKSNNYYRDSLTNAYGSLWKVQYGEQIGFVFSGFVSKMPYPKNQNLSFVEYGKMYLNLIDSVKYSANKSLNENGSQSESEYEESTYRFEQGIVISEHNGSVTAGEVIYIPGVSVEEGFYILQAFGVIDLFAYFENRIPDYDLKYNDRPIIDYMYGESKINKNGFLTYVGINVEISHFHITLDHDAIIIDVGSGC